jgi:hypothetical protein
MKGKIGCPTRIVAKFLVSLSLLSLNLLNLRLFCCFCQVFFLFFIIFYSLKLQSPVLANKDFA